MRRTKYRRREANKVLSNWVYMYNIVCKGEHKVKQSFSEININSDNVGDLDVRRTLHDFNPFEHTDI